MLHEPVIRVFCQDAAEFDQFGPNNREIPSQPDGGLVGQGRTAGERAGDLDLDLELDVIDGFMLC